MKSFILTIVLTFALQNQVYCQLQNYSDQGKVKILTEKTTLSVVGIPKKITEGDVEVAVLPAVAAAAAILPPVIDFVVSGFKGAVKKNARAYKGAYSCFASEENFYESYNYALLPKLVIKRTVKMKDKRDITAVEIELIPELSADKTAFRYYIQDKLIYNLSIAKTKGNYNYIDLNLEIKFKSIYIDKNEYKINDLRTTAIFIPMIYVGQTTQLPEKIYSGWIPLLPRSTMINTQVLPIIEDKTIVKTDNEGNKDSSSEITTTKRSDTENYEQIMNYTGLYEIEINATETNPYKIKAENQQAILESSSESSSALLKAIISVLTEKE